MSVLGGWWACSLRIGNTKLHRPPLQPHITNHLHPTTTLRCAAAQAGQDQRQRERADSGRPQGIPHRPEERDAHVGCARACAAWGCCVVVTCGAACWHGYPPPCLARTFTTQPAHQFCMPPPCTRCVADVVGAVALEVLLGTGGTAQLSARLRLSWLDPLLCRSLQSAWLATQSALLPNAVLPAAIITVLATLCVCRRCYVRRRGGSGLGLWGGSNPSQPRMGEE